MLAFFIFPLHPCIAIFGVIIAILYSIAFVSLQLYCNAFVSTKFGEGESPLVFTHVVFECGFFIPVIEEGLCVLSTFVGRLLYFPMVLGDTSPFLTTFALRWMKITSIQPIPPKTSPITNGMLQPNEYLIILCNSSGD